MSSTPHRPGAVSVGAREGRRKRGGFMKWLLPLLLLAAIIVALILLLGGGKDSKGASAGKVSAAGNQLLPVPKDGLQPLVGTKATADSVRVQSVVKGEGFWVGSSMKDRVYVEYGGKTGSDEADFTPKVGDRVKLSGPVRPSPVQPASALHLNAADGRLVKQEGGFINADQVTKVG